MSAIPVIRSIQYLRGIAALMIVWHHGLIQLTGAFEWLPPALHRFGNSGVDLFFVISGFIMVVSVTGRPTTPMNFFWRRIVRVVPLYWVLTSIMVIASILAPSLFKTLIVSPSTLILSLLFIPHFSASFPAAAWPLLVPGWTLNYEMFFYAVFAVCLAFPKTIRMNVLVATMLGLVLARYAFGPFSSAVGLTYTDPLLLEFVAGVVTGLVFSAGRLQISFGTATACIIMGFLLLATRDSEWFHFFGQLCGATLIVIGSLHPKISAFRSSILEQLGDASYSIYLTHLFTLGILRVMWGKIFPHETSHFQAIAFITSALVLASFVGWLCFRIVESRLSARMAAVGRNKNAAHAAT